MTTVSQDLAEALRPKSLDDLIIDGTTRSVIAKAIERQSRKWLIHGPTGTGKTTLARMVVQALRGPDTPCEEPDVLEINAADLNGVSAIRDLLDRTATYPMFGNYRVTILDEAHQLTKQAQTALLKPFEQSTPMVWILCTTELKDIQDPLRDRCGTQIFMQPMNDAGRRELVARAARYLNYNGDTTRFLNTINKQDVGTARNVLNAFQRFVDGIPFNEAVGR